MIPEQCLTFPVRLVYVCAECRLVKSVNYGKMSGSLIRGSPRTVVQSRRSKSPASGKLVKKSSVLFFFFSAPLSMHSDTVLLSL